MYDDYIYYFLQVLGTFAAVPDKPRIVDVFRDWRLVAILHKQTTTPDKNHQQNYTLHTQYERAPLQVRSTMLP